MDEMEPRSLFLFIAGSVLPSLLIALAATYLVRRNAAAWGLIDLPGERKIHTTPTPRGGGIAIWLGVVGAFACAQGALWLVSRDSNLAELVPESIWGDDRSP